MNRLIGFLQLRIRIRLFCWAAGLVLCAGAAAQPFSFPAGTPPPPRSELLAKYDSDQDGRLSDKERETMRQARFEERRRESASGRGGFRFQFPPEIVKKYDKDGDGQLNDEENADAREGIRRQWEQISKDYDKNGNGRLDEPEMAAVQEDIESGKIQGIPRMFAGPRGGRGGSRRGSGQHSRAEILRQSDLDGDGRLNEAELRAARDTLGKAAATPARP